MKRIAAVLAAAAVLALILMPRRRVDAPPAVDAPAPRQAAGADDTVPRVASADVEARIARPKRNLFAYYEAPRVIEPEPVMVPVAQPRPVVVETPPALAAAPTPPHFPYRYIGAFGPRHDPIAAFVGADRIVTVRPGDRIDEQFVLRAIGLESVEIEARGWDRRIPVALSAGI